MKRRQFLQAAGALSLAGCASVGGSKAARGGDRRRLRRRHAAKYMRMAMRHRRDAGRPRHEFVSCPLSNLVLGGNRTMADITRSYDGLRKYGVQLVNGEAVAIDTAKKTVAFGRGSALTYDRLVLSPERRFPLRRGRGLRRRRSRMLHAWKAGPQTVALRRQLEAMPDGGVYVLSIPTAPYRCPPGPYERACQVAALLQAREAALEGAVLDANPDVTSEAPRSSSAPGRSSIPGIVEYRPNAKVIGVDATR